MIHILTVITVIKDKLETYTKSSPQLLVSNQVGSHSGKGIFGENQQKDKI